MRNIWNRMITLHHTSQIIHPSHLHHNWLAMQTPRRKCDLLMVIKGGGGTIHHRFQNSDCTATPLWCWFTAGVPTTTTKLRRAQSLHELSEVYECAIVIRWPVYTYLRILQSRTVVLPPHKGLCGAQACNFAACASCNRVMWSTSTYFTILSPPHTTAKPTSDKLGKFYDPICWGCANPNLVTGDSKDGSNVMSRQCWPLIFLLQKQQCSFNLLVIKTWL